MNRSISPSVTRARRAEGYRFVHVLPPFRWVWGRRIQLGQPPAQRLGILQKLRRAVILHKFQEGPGRALALGLGEKAEPVMLRAFRGRRSTPCQEKVCTPASRRPQAAYACHTGVGRHIDRRLPVAHGAGYGAKQPAAGIGRIGQRVAVIFKDDRNTCRQRFVGNAAGILNQRGPLGFAALIGRTGAGHTRIAGAPSARAVSSTSQKAG